MRQQPFRQRHFSGRNRSAPRPNFELLNAIRASESAQKTASVEAETVYMPQHQFADFSISEELKSNIAAKGYSTPTPIQDQAIGEILAGKDIIGTSNTGTGKTAAFLIPLVEKVFRNKAQRVLIVTPTRELALQITQELREFARGLGLRTALVIGGASMWRQRNDIRQDPHFVIGTPGRLKDVIRGKILSMSQFRNVVLDEADRMVDIGFINDIKYFISLLPTPRQSLFFSATISGKVGEVLRLFVKNPVTISIKKHDAAVNVNQNLVKVVDKYKKVDQLHDLLIQKGFDKVLVFGRTKWGVQKLADELTERGFKVAAIHGNKRQNQRQHVLDQFKRNEIQILLATDVASRGLDIPDVSHVINYDLPSSMDDYIHRIGRTGRADKKGIALTFVE